MGKREHTKALTKISTKLQENPELKYHDNSNQRPINHFNDFLYLSPHNQLFHFLQRTIYYLYIDILLLKPHKLRTHNRGYYALDQLQ